MKRLPIITFVFILVICASAGCSNRSDTTTRLSGMEDYIDINNLESAETLRAGLVKDTMRLSAEELAHLAIMSMKLAEHADNNSVIGDAIKCLRRGMRIDPKSVQAYLKTVSIENERYVRLLCNIINSLDNPAVIHDDFSSMVDTIAIDTIM